MSGVSATHSRAPWPEQEVAKLRELFAAGMDDTAISNALGRTPKGIIHQRRKLGLFTPNPPPAVIPPDFAEWAADKTLYQIKRRFGIGHGRAVELRKQYGLKPQLKIKTKLPVPADFFAVAPTLTMTKARAHYGVHHNVIARWYAETGIESAVYVPKAAPKARKVANVNWGARQPVNFGNVGDGSIAHAAANHLRRIGFANVYRATVLDRAARVHLPDEGKHHYAVSGRGFMHQDEMVALAEARGFGVERGFAA